MRISEEPSDHQPCVPVYRIGSDAHRDCIDLMHIGRAFDVLILYSVREFGTEAKEAGGMAHTQGKPGNDENWQDSSTADDRSPLEHQTTHVGLGPFSLEHSSLTKPGSRANRAGAFAIYAAVALGAGFVLAGGAGFPALPAPWSKVVGLLVAVTIIGVGLWRTRSLTHSKSARHRSSDED